MQILQRHSHELPGLYSSGIRYNEADIQIPGGLRSDVLKALAQRGSDWRVRDIMRREFEVVDDADMLDTAFARLQSCNCHTLPVTRRGALVGLLTMENVGEFLLIQSALGRSPQPRVA